LDSFTKINTDYISEEDFDVVDYSPKYKVSRKPYRPTHFSQNPSYQIDLSSASRGSKWFTAIERNDCKTLLQLLETNPKLGLQTGPGGRSALHVAIMQGCTELVYKLHKYQALPSEEGDYSAFEILSEEARDHSIPDASEFEILWKLARDDCMQNASALDIWSIMDANSSERSSDDYISAHPMRPLLSDEEEAEISSLRKVMSSYQERFEMDMDDVNFNFDVRSELLVHMACSRLRNIVFKKFPLKDESDSSVRGQLFEIVTFISTVLEELKDENLLQKLFKQKDARGRTILQVFVASKYPIANENKTWVEDEFRKLLKILPSDCVNACDSVERTALHWAVAHHSCWAVKILVESGKADLCKTCKTAHYKNVTALHLAVIHDCDNCARHLLKSDCNLKQMSLWMEIDISFSSHSQKKWRPLDLAIIMARVKLARTMKQMMVCFTYLIPHS
jgi:ankyrin repeat protein